MRHPILFLVLASVASFAGSACSPSETSPARAAVVPSGMTAYRFELAKVP
jgi:hypothetical protein